MCDPYRVVCTAYRLSLLLICDPCRVNRVAHRLTVLLICASTGTIALFTFFAATKMRPLQGRWHCSHFSPLLMCDPYRVNRIAHRLTVLLICASTGTIALFTFFAATKMRPLQGRWHCSHFSPLLMCDPYRVNRIAHRLTVLLMYAPTELWFIIFYIKRHSKHQYPSHPVNILRSPIINS